MNHTKIVFLTLLILTISCIPIQINGLEVITMPISRPLPTLPEPILSGDSLQVEVTFNFPHDITASLYSHYDSGFLVLSGEPIEKDDVWVINFDVPDLRPGLYDLHISFNGKDYVQERSVWVLDDWPESITISQISDIHQPYGGANFSQYIYEQNLLNPDLILVTGDVVDVETIARAWQNLHETLNFSKVPVYLLPGNHDHTNFAQYYKQYGGKTNYTITIGDFFIVALNSHGGGYVTIEEIEWADKVLSENCDKVKILAFHHPLFSGEYEEDLGVLKGGEISGDWQQIEELTDKMYFTWTQNIENAKALLRVIQENNVDLMLSGHVHRDLIYDLNGENLFVTTTTIGGGSSQYRGYRQVTINANGVITLDEYGESNKYNPPNSIPLGKIKYVYKQANDGTRTAVYAIIENNLEISLRKARLEFIVNQEIDSSSYAITPAPKSSEVLTTNNGHHFITYYDVMPETTLTATIYANEDGISPEIILNLIEDPEMEKFVTGDITVTDNGWGVKDIKASFSFDNSTWRLLPLTQEPAITPSEWKINIVEDVYSFAFSGEDTTTVKIEATDFAGNTAIKESTIKLSTTEPTPEPANIIYKSISINPAVVGINQEFTVSIMLENIGDVTDTEIVELYLDDELMDDESVEVESGSSEEVRFTLIKKTPGVFTVKAGDKTTTLTVEESEPEPEPRGIPIPSVYILLGVLLVTLYLASTNSLIIRKL